MMSPNASPPITPRSPSSSASSSRPLMPIAHFALLLSMIVFTLVVVSNIHHTQIDPVLRNLQSSNNPDTNAQAALEKARNQVLDLLSNVTKLQGEVERQRQKEKERAETFVDQVYFDLLKEAERRSKLDYKSSHDRGERGIVIGPVDGKFYYTVQAMKNAQRIRNILQRDDSGVKLAIITSIKHVKLLNGCKEKKLLGVPRRLTREACRLWANGTLFDDVILNKEPVWTNRSHVSEHKTSRYIMISLGGSLVAPYKQSLMLDSDSYPCPGVEKLFDVLHPYNEKKLWSLPSTKTVDLLTAHEQYPWQSEYWQPVLGKGTDIHSDFKHFADRNCGTLLFNFQNQLTHTFAHFVQLVAAHVINNVASQRLLVLGEQTPFKIALYIFKRLRPAFHEEQFPSHVVCRTYVNKSYAGVDGSLNGMYPLQDNGMPCSHCYCTPCLINHHHEVTVDGTRMGWEEGEIANVSGNSLPVPLSN